MQAGSLKLARLAAIGASLRLDTAAAAVVRSLERAGVAAVLLKGRSFARWLYPDSRDRPYRDVDLLVSDFEVAQRALRSIGYRLEFDDDGMPSWWREHSGTWFRRSDGTTIDLHRTLPGTSVSDRAVWRLLSSDAELMPIAGADVPVLSVPARALHVVLHAAQHGVGWDWPMADLERALIVCDAQHWRIAAKLAAELGALDAFVAGLHLVSEGSALARRLELPTNYSVEARLRATSGTPTALGLELLAQTSPAQRIRVVSRKLVPPPEFIRNWDPRAADSRLALLRAYLYRPVWLLRLTPRSVRAWRRAHKAAQGLTGR